MHIPYHLSLRHPIALTVSHSSTKQFLFYDIHMSVHRNTISNYSQQDATLFEFIYFYRRSTCFRRFLRPSSGAHNCTYSFRYCQPILLLAATVEEISCPLTSSQLTCMIYTVYAVCTVLNSWWWMERPSETCRVIFIKLENCASSWFYYRNISRCTVPWTSDFDHFPEPSLALLIVVSYMEC